MFGDVIISDDCLKIKLTPYCDYEWSMDRLQDTDSIQRFIYHIAEKSWCSPRILKEVSREIDYETGIRVDIDDALWILQFHQNSWLEWEKRYSDA